MMGLEIDADRNMAISRYAQTLCQVKQVSLEAVKVLFKQWSRIGAP